MPINTESVVVFDDKASSRSTIYAESAIAAVYEAGLEPQAFDEFDEAEKYCLAAGENFKAMICSLGSKSLGSFSMQYPAQNLLSHARFRSVPVALLSGSPYARNYVHPTRGDIIVPKQPTERIKPMLVQWLSCLATEQA